MLKIVLQLLLLVSYSLSDPEPEPEIPPAQIDSEPIVNDDQDNIKDDSNQDDPNIKQLSEDLSLDLPDNLPEVIEKGGFELGDPPSDDLLDDSNQHASISSQTSPVLFIFLLVVAIAIGLFINRRKIMGYILEGNKSGNRRRNYQYSRLSDA